MVKHYLVLVGWVKQIIWALHCIVQPSYIYIDQVIAVVPLWQFYGLM